MNPTPVHEAAAGLAIEAPRRCKDPEFVERLRSLAPAAMVVAAYGQILPQAMLDIALCLNLHGSILPKYRGAAPIQRAIMAGESETGVSLMRMVLEMDAGDVYAIEKTPIGLMETGRELETRLSEMAAEMIAQHLEAILEGRLDAAPQDHSAATFAPKIVGEDFGLRWDETARQCHDRRRALWPRAFAVWKGRRVKALKSAPAEGNGAPGEVLAVGEQGLLIACGQGALWIDELQPEGKSKMSAQSFANGYRARPGDRFDLITAEAAESR